MSAAALLLVGASALIHALWNLQARRLSGNLAAIWLGLCLASVLGLPLLGLGKSGLAEALPYLAATGALNALYFLLLAMAYEEGPVSFVYPLARGVAVAGTAAASALVWREPFSGLGVLGVAAVVLGSAVLALTRASSSARPASAGSWRAPVCAVLAGAAVAATYRVDKLGSARVDPISYIAGLCLFCAAFLAPYILVRRRTQLAEAWRSARGASAFIGVGSMAGYLLILYAYRLGALSYVVAAREFSVVIGSLLGVAVLGEAVGLASGLGIASIAAGLVLLRLA